MPDAGLLQCLLELGLPTSMSYRHRHRLCAARPPVPLYLMVVSTSTHYVALQEIGRAAPPCAAGAGTDAAAHYLDLDNTQTGAVAAAGTDGEACSVGSKRTRPREKANV